MKIPTDAECKNHYGVCAWILNDATDWREVMRLVRLGNGMDTPFRQGYAAHDCGQHRNANPYPSSTDQHAEWVRGFQKSDRDSRPATE